MLETYILIVILHEIFNARDINGRNVKVDTHPEYCKRRKRDEYYVSYFLTGVVLCFVHLFVFRQSGPLTGESS